MAGTVFPRSLSWELTTVSNMPVNSDNLQVIIPYRELVNLLNASQRVESLDKKMERLLEQQAALRLQFLELMETFKQNL